LRGRSRPATRADISRRLPMLRSAFRLSIAAASATALLAVSALLDGAALGSAALRAGTVAIVLGWALAVYGRTGALAAATVAACAAIAAGPAAIEAHAATAAQLGFAFALARCLLDPAVQWIAATAALLCACMLVEGAVFGAVEPSRSLAVFSVLAGLARVATTERHESRPRVLQAAAASLALVWALGLAVTAAVAGSALLPTPIEYTHATGVLPLLAAPAGTAAVRSAPALAIPLVLACVRPWRWERRYSDAIWVLAAVGVLAPRWRAADPAGAAAAAAGLGAVLALLGAACWDRARPPWWRHAASAALALQIGWVLLLPPTTGGAAARPDGDPPRAERRR
jgi:hypothetical protein